MSAKLNHILVIQTAFIGDVILATALVEKIHASFPSAKIDLLVRKGNEALLKKHPFLNEILIWDKKGSKYKNLFQILQQIRKSKYDAVINTQRFGSTGFLTALSGAKIKSGFTKNPFSFGFTHSYTHEIGNGTHEVERNQQLIESFTTADLAKPKLYPSENDFAFIKQFTHSPFITISPTSVWFTKQYPAEKWAEFIDMVPSDLTIFLLGGPDDSIKNEELIALSKSNTPKNLAGKLSFLQSAALLSKSKLNYVNDSGPLHLCSAMNAPVASLFCSTIPQFGFTPLSDENTVIETRKNLECRPCGIHGKNECPQRHFDCAYTINKQQLMDPLISRISES